VIHWETTRDGERLVLRDFEEQDLEGFHRYWYESEPAFLQNMGVEPSLLPAREVRDRNFRKLIGANPATCDSYVLTMEFAGKPIGYALCNYIDRARGTCEGHIHFFQQESRRKGYASLVFTSMIERTTELLGVQEMILEPSANNAAVNGFLQKLGYKPELTFLKPARGICRAMEVNRYRWVSASASLRRRGA
jgi:RimJ/RimL family protein N-acetyltransferase